MCHELIIIDTIESRGPADGRWYFFCTLSAAFSSVLPLISYSRLCWALIGGFIKTFMPIYAKTIDPRQKWHMNFRLAIFSSIQWYPPRYTLSEHPVYLIQFYNLDVSFIKLALSKIPVWMIEVDFEILKISTIQFS